MKLFNFVNQPHIYIKQSVYNYGQKEKERGLDILVPRAFLLFLTISDSEKKKLFFFFRCLKLSGEEEVGVMNGG